MTCSPFLQVPIHGSLVFGPNVWKNMCPSTWSNVPMDQPYPRPMKKMYLSLTVFL